MLDSAPLLSIAPSPRALLSSGAYDVVHMGAALGMYYTSSINMAAATSASFWTSKTHVISGLRSRYAPRVSVQLLKGIGIGKR